MTGGARSLPPPPGEEGFTLVELLVSLAIFALISLAGVQLIQTMIGVQDRTEARGERLGALQRGLYLFTADLEHLSGGPALEDGILTFTRSSAGSDYGVSYRFADDAVYRGVGEHELAVLSGVETYAVRFLKDGTWQVSPGDDEDPRRPEAVEISIDMAAGPGVTGGPVRRVVELPQEP